MLEAVLDGLGGGLAAGRLDRVLERGERLRLGLDQPLQRGLGPGVEARRGDLGGGLAAERGDLLDQPAGVVDLMPSEVAEALGEQLVLQPEQAPGGVSLLTSRPSRWKASRVARAMIVSWGFTPSALGTTEPSAT